MPIFQTGYQKRISWKSSGYLEYHRYAMYKYHPEQLGPYPGNMAASANGAMVLQPPDDTDAEPIVPTSVHSKPLPSADPPSMQVSAPGGDAYKGNFEKGL